MTAPPAPPASLPDAMRASPPPHAAAAAPRLPRPAADGARAAPSPAPSGLATPARFLERAGRLLRRRAAGKGGFTVLCLALERVDAVSDGLGPVASEALRADAARRVRAALRPGDVVARLGGDELAVLLEGVADADAAVRVAAKLQREVALPFRVAGHNLFTTACVGVAVAAEGYASAGDLLRDAHAAMGRARTGGGGGCRVFDPSMHAAAVEQLCLGNGLRGALERGELVLHYQPIVSLDEGRITAFEALLRWRHPVRGLLYPGAFLAAAEESGLIVPIGRWALREACRQMRSWREAHPAGASVAVNVNLSTRQFLQPGIVHEVEEALRESGLPGNALRLEITESAVMERAQESVELLCRLKALGVQLCIDDFGMGYSSLGYLHRFPVDVLKIDRSFVRGLGVHGESTGIVRAIVALAHGLGMHAVPEGVETPEHLACVRELECGFGQGHLFSAALDPEQAGALLRDDRRW